MQLTENIKEHPWVTKNGEDPLLSEEENCSEPIEVPNALELNHAVTRRMSHLFCVVSELQLSMLHSSLTLSR